MRDAQERRRESDVVCAAADALAVMPHVHRVLQRPQICRPAARPEVPGETA